MTLTSDSVSPGESVSRRQLLSGFLVPGLYAFAARNPAEFLNANQRLADDANRSRTSLHLEVELPAPPAKILDALLDEKKFASFSGYEAEIDPRAGGAFSLFGGLVSGRNVEIVPGARLVQAWRPAHWDDGVYSLVRFEFAAFKAGSTLIFDQAGFPSGSYDFLALGWNLRYWLPLKKFFT